MIYLTTLENMERIKITLLIYLEGYYMNDTNQMSGRIVIR